MEALRSQEVDSPILSWFVVGEIPEGEAPVEIKEQWLGIALPVRERAPRHDRRVGVTTGSGGYVERAIPVRTADAIVALRAADREDAAAWWEANGYAHGVPVLLFNDSEGRLVRGSTLEDDQVAPFYGGTTPYA